MSFLFVIFALWLVYNGVSWIGDQFAKRRSIQLQPPPSDAQTKPASPNTFRPTSGGRRTEIKFRSTSPDVGDASSGTASDLSEINDAFTGRRIDPNQRIFECITCHVFYQAESVIVLREANNAKCMACGSTQISEYGNAKSGAKPKARNYAPDAVTLANYRQHINRVVTFTGYVQDVKQSRRGLDYAVMFENASWNKGLKLVAFKGGVRKLGGGAKLKSYAGKTITVRGLLIHHPIFGPEIIVDDPAMILRVEA